MSRDGVVRPYRVRFEEATPEGLVRPAQFLCWFSDCAWQHSIALGCDRPWYQRRGLFLLVRATRLEVLRPVPTYSEVTVSTKVIGWRRVSARRESEVRDGNGELLARGEIDWVMTNERGMPDRFPPGFEELFGGPRKSFEMHRLALGEAPAGAFEGRFRVRRRDLDPLDHVNNSVYVDYFEEALENAGQAALLTAVPRRYTLDFVSSAARGEALVGRTWPADGGWCYRLTRPDGTEILRARLEPLG